VSEWRKEAFIHASKVILENDVKRVLELGCDDAGISRELAKVFPNVLFEGIDVRVQKVSDAVRIALEENLGNTNFQNGYFMNVENKNNRYDLIIFTEVYEHLIAENQILALRKIGTLLKDKGFLIMTCPNGEYFLSELENRKTFEDRYEKDFFDNLLQTEHWLEPSYRELSKILVSLGYELFLHDFFNLPKRKIKLIHLVEKLLNKVFFVRQKIFKSQIVIARKNGASPLLTKFHIFDDLQ